MGQKYEKWRELLVDPFDINYKEVKIKKIISYPPAGNDVIECICEINNNIENVFIKIERSKVCDFKAEARNLDILYNEKYYSKIPKVYEKGIFNNKDYIVLEKKNGERLSDILKNENEQINKKDYLLKYGYELSVIHEVPISEFEVSKQRIINDYPKKEIYSKFDESINPYIEYLMKNKPEIKFNTFIHGDFHYANILWENNEILAVLDFEYSGRGFKEQDIAWSCVLRPTQTFMDNLNDIKNFLTGYLKNGEFNNEALKWCLINTYCHFYLMNLEKIEYKNKLLELIRIIKEYNFDALK